MSITSLPARSWRAVDRLQRRRTRLERLRVRVGDGARTTLHVASYDTSAYTPRVALFDSPEPLVWWCKRQDVRHAVVGGFFVRPQYAPLGHLQVNGQIRPSVPFDAPWDRTRACLHIAGGTVRICRRDELGEMPQGDLLQAGPLLVSEALPTVSETEDVEGFSAGARQFDSDITDGRYPRAALAIAGDRLLAVACDGRGRRDAGMTLPELADALIDLGATHALNLDGGGSASLVYQGRLRNRPREEHGAELLAGRAVVSAIVFEPRGRHRPHP